MEEKKKAKPRALKPSIKRLIFTRAIKERQEPREFLAHRLIKEIEELGEIPPSHETAKRYISAARNTNNPIDKPWSLGACRDYSQNFPSHCINLLIEYLKFEPYIDGSQDPSSGHKFSIRKAIWMVRLESTIKKYLDGDLTTLSIISDAYASAELASETMGEKYFNSSEFDIHLINGDINGFLELLCRKEESIQKRNKSSEQEDK